MVLAYKKNNDQNINEQKKKAAKLKISNNFPLGFDDKFLLISKSFSNLKTKLKVYFWY